MRLEAAADGGEQHDEADDQHRYDAEGEGQVRWYGLASLLRAQAGHDAADAPRVLVVVAACARQGMNDL